jgi:LEA14-like dessication related protein
MIIIVIIIIINLLYLFAIPNILSSCDVNFPTPHIRPLSYAIEP